MASSPAKNTKATWPKVIAVSLQEALVSAVEDAAAKVVPRMDSHGDENGFTAALGQVLVDTGPLVVGDKIVKFDYRRLNDKTEEPEVGADGGIILSIETRHRVFEKYVLFQAKKLPKEEKISSLRMPLREARRFGGQLTAMNAITDSGVVGLFYTRAGVYVVDGDRLVDEAGAKKSVLRAPMAPPFRPLRLGTYLGKWVATCRKGGTSPDIVSRIRKKDGFEGALTGGLGHLFEASVRPRDRLGRGGHPDTVADDDGDYPALPGGRTVSGAFDHLRDTERTRRQR